MNPDLLFSEFEQKRVLVIGDTIVDVRSEVEPIKPLDDGTSTYRKVLNERGQADEYSLGGAALVVRNLLELGAQVDFITAFGHGHGALQCLNWKQNDLTVHAIQTAKPQTVKHRYWCGGKKVFAADVFDNTSLTEDQALCASRNFDLCLGLFSKSHDAMVIADYRHGFINEKMARNFVSAGTINMPVYVSSQVSQSDGNHRWYDSEKTIFVANDREWESMGGTAPFASRVMVKTWGSLGAYCVDKNFHDPGKRCFVTDAIKVDVRDTCGAGDAFLAMFSLTQNLRTANIWAGLSCTAQGANPPSRKMMEEWWDASPS